MRLVRGFSLVELAVVMAIVALLLGSVMYTLGARVEQQGRIETQRKLEEARDLLLAFAVVNGRLPCPARSNSGGDEVRLSATGECKNAAAVEDYWGGQLSDLTFGGFLPGRTLGFQPVDSSGFALDAWGNRIRYALARSVQQTTSCTTTTFPHWTNRDNLKANGTACKPCDGDSATGTCYSILGGTALITDLLVCSGSVVATGSPIASAACSTGQSVTNQGVIAAVVFSTGRNGSIGSAPGANELENVDGDNIFISKTPDPVGTATGEYDDMVVWIPVSVLYSRLIAAGLLP